MSTPQLSLTDAPFHPEAHEALSASYIGRAFWLNESIHAIKYESIHGAPEGLTEEQITQRKQLLSIPIGILTRARDREMDKACAHWQAYRRATSP
jgi:hypothetical protein